MRIASVPLNGRCRGRLLRWFLLSAIAGCAALPAASKASSTPAVSPPTKSLTAQFWQTYVSIPSGDAAGRCDLGTGRVVFLGATGTGTVNASCTLSAGTSVLLPLINVECSSLEAVPFFGRNPGQRLLCAERFADDFSPVALTINGVDASNLSRLRVRSQPFEFSPVADNMFFIPAGTGGSVSDGYWALIGPLAAGDYDVFAAGSRSVAPSFSTSITYRLHVV